MRKLDIGHTIHLLIPFIIRHDDVHGTASSIDLLPVSYRYNCSNGNPGPADCGDKEEFDYYNIYGLVQWKHWKLESGTLVLVEQSVHDHLKPDDGDSWRLFSVLLDRL